MTFRTLQNFINFGSDLVASVGNRKCFPRVQGGHNEVSHLPEMIGFGNTLGKLW